MGCAVERRTDEHLSLERRKRGHRRERRACLQALLHELINLVSAGRLRNLVWHGDHDAEVVERDVVGDAVEPRPDIPHLRAGLQRPPRSQKRLLEGVLGVPRLRLEPPTVGEQLPAVPAHQGLECRFVPLPREGYEAAVGLGLKKVE